MKNLTIARLSDSANLFEGCEPESLIGIDQNASVQKYEKAVSDLLTAWGDGTQITYEFFGNDQSVLANLCDVTITASCEGEIAGGLSVSEVHRAEEMVWNNGEFWVTN